MVTLCFWHKHSLICCCWLHPIQGVTRPTEITSLIPHQQGLRLDRARPPLLRSDL